MLYDLDLGRIDLELSPSSSAHHMQGVPEKGQTCLFWKTVFHRLHGQIRKHSLAMAALFAALISNLLD